MGFCFRCHLPRYTAVCTENDACLCAECEDNDRRTVEFEDPDEDYDDEETDDDEDTDQGHDEEGSDDDFLPPWARKRDRCESPVKTTNPKKRKTA